MITILWILAYISGYLLLGVGLVKYDTPRSITRNMHYRGERIISHYDWGVPVYKEVDNKYLNRDFVSVQQWTNMFLWPIMIWYRITENSTESAMNKVDPLVLKRLKDENEKLQLEIDEQSERETKSLQDSLTRQIEIATMQKQLKELEK